MTTQPAIDLLNLVWNNHSKAVPHSWSRINSAMREALRLAIGSGMKFNTDDFKYIHANYNSGYWLNHEDIYTQAIVEGNLSAARSFESWKGRKPIIADNVSYTPHHTFCHKSHGGLRSRLAVGFSFSWKGTRVTVTSFKDDALVACSYSKETSNGYSKQRVRKRYTITAKDVQQERARLKEQDRKAEELCQRKQDAARRLLEAVDSQGSILVGRIFDRLDIRPKAGQSILHQWANLPIGKLESAVKEFCHDLP